MFSRFNVSGQIDVDKTSNLKECDICHYYCFLDRRLTFQPKVCNGCHDELMMSVNLSNIAILNINGADYRYIISGISRSDAINVMQNIDLTEKSGTL